LARKNSAQAKRGNTATKFQASLFWDEDTAEGFLDGKKITNFYKK